MKDSLHKPKYKAPLKELLGAKPKKPFINLACPSCGRVSKAGDIDLSSQLGKCSHCDVIFSVKDELKGLIEESKSNEPLPKPVGIEIFKYSDELEIEMAQPFNWLDALMGGVVFLTLLITLGFVKGKIPLHIISYIWALNIYPIYYFFRRSRARLHILLNRQNLKVQYRPKNGVKDKSWPVEQIEQMYCKTSDTGYTLRMITNGLEGQEHITIAHSSQGMTKLRYLEQILENHLQIVDRPVPEEDGYSLGKNE